LALAGLAVAATLAGCGGSDGGSVAVEGPDVGAPIGLADCTDWQAASAEQRLGTIRQLRNFAGGPVVGGNAQQPSGTGAVLNDEKAYDLLDNYCKNDYARAFKLYKLYERGAAFAGQ
jgi:hypothetical protein